MLSSPAEVFLVPAAVYRFGLRIIALKAIFSIDFLEIRLK